MARKILWGVLALLILTIAGGYVLIKTKGDVLLQKFGAYVEETTGAPLVMDQLPSLKFFPNPGLDLGQASWGREDGDLFVRFDRASVRVAAGSLLAGKVDITGMEVDGLDVSVRLQPKTEADAAPQPATATAPPAPAGAQAFDPARLEAALTRILTVAPNALTVRDGRLTLQLPDGASAVFSHLNLTLKNVRPGGDTSLNLTARVEGRHPDLSGSLELAANATLADSGLNVTIRKAAFTPESGLPFTETVALTGTGVYGLRNGSLKLSSLSVQGPGLSASASGETASIPALLRQLPGKAPAWLQFTAEGSPRALLTALGRAVPLADPATLTRAAVSGRVDTGEGLVRLTKLNGTLDATTFSGDVDLRPAPLALSGDLQVGDIALDPYLPARADTPKPDAPPAARPATTAASATGSKAWPLWPEMNLALRVNSVQARGVRVEDIQAKVEGKNGAYTVNPLTCRAFGSPITAALKAAASASGAVGPTAQVTANISAPQIDLDQLSKALFKQVPLAGAGTLNTTLSCNTAAPLPTLNGKGSLSAAPLTLALNLLPPNAPAPAGTPRNSRFDKAMLTYEVHNGVMTITDCTLTAPSLNAAGKGQVNLVAQTLDVSGTVQLPGLAVLPVRLTGPWSAPTYSLNARTTFDAVDQTLKQRGVDLGQEIQKGLGRLFRKK